MLHLFAFKNLIKIYMKSFIEFLRWFFTMSPKADGIMIQWCYLKPLVFKGKRLRYLGFAKDYYDGPHYCFGFWFYHIILSPLGSESYRNYDLRMSLNEATKLDPDYHLLSSDKAVRASAMEHIRERNRNRK